MFPRRKLLAGENSPPIRVGRFVLALCAFWTLLLAGALANSWANLSKTTRDVAYHSARTALVKDMVYRRWNAAHGGVYVPANRDTPPNFFLEAPDREIPGPGGATLTLVNPAYMTRQVNELFQAKTDIRTKLTSLRPLNPANAPDAWELQALESLEQGAPEVSDLAQVKEQISFRLMLPFRVEESCLKCHARQGYQQGDLRGGIVVSIAMQPFLAAMYSQFRTSGLNLGALWLAGLGGLGLTSRLLARQVGMRLAAERGHRQSESLLRETSRLGRIGGGELDEDSGELVCTEGFRELLGLPTAGRIDLDRILDAAQDDGERETLREAIRRSAENGEDFTLQARLVRRDATRWMQVLGRLQERGGRVLLMIQDITERKGFEQMREDMERIVRHDLRGPLTSIIGLSDIIMDSNLTPDQTESLCFIQDAGYKMLRMINSLMSLSRIEDGTFRLQATHLDLLPVLDAIAKELVPTARRKNLAFAILVDGRPREPGDAFPVLGEDILVFSLLFNLLQNAVDAAPPGTTVTIALAGDGQAEIAVHNLGAVPPAVRGRFFEKYVSAGKKTGTGLGTYSAKLFAEAQGGSISLATSEELGVTVTVRLPR
jgi:signal transduction histidine kinase